MEPGKTLLDPRLAPVLHGRPGHNQLSCDGGVHLAIRRSLDDRDAPNQAIGRRTRTNQAPKSIPPGLRQNQGPFLRSSDPRHDPPLRNKRSIDHSHPYGTLPAAQNASPHGRIRAWPKGRASRRAAASNGWSTDRHGRTRSRRSPSAHPRRRPVCSSRRSGCSAPPG